MLSKLDETNLPNPVEAKTNTEFAAARAARGRVLRINRNIAAVAGLIEIARAEGGDAAARIAVEVADAMTYDDFAVQVSAMSDNDAFFNLFSTRMMARMSA